MCWTVRINIGIRPLFISLSLIRIKKKNWIIKTVFQSSINPKCSDLKAKETTDLCCLSRSIHHPGIFPNIFESLSALDF